jgi:hypothetical protein
MTQIRQAVVVLYLRRAQDDDVIDRVGQTPDLHHVSCMTRLASNNDSIIWCLGHKIMLLNDGTFIREYSTIRLLSNRH